MGTPYRVSVPIKLSHEGVHPCRSRTHVYQNCTKTLCNCCFGAYFEREADSPLENIENVKQRLESLACRNALAKQVLSREERHACGGANCYPAQFDKRRKPLCASRHAPGATMAGKIA